VTGAGALHRFLHALDLGQQFQIETGALARSHVDPERTLLCVVPDLYLLVPFGKKP
jgi:hypothetical protein